MNSDLLIGKVLRPRGLKGEVKMEIYSSDPHWLNGFKGEIVVGGKRFRALKFSHDGDFGYATLEGVESAEQAEELRGEDVFANRADVPKLRDGENYIVDIIGLDVLVGGENIGKIVDVAQYGSADVYTVKTSDGTLSFPALKILIKEVDLSLGAMKLDASVFERVAVRN